MNNVCSEGPRCVLEKKNMSRKKQGKHHYQQTDTSGGNMKYTYVTLKHSMCFLPKTDLA